MQGTLSEKVKATAVRQEVEKLQDLQNAALRAVFALFKLPNEGLFFFGFFYSVLSFSNPFSLFCNLDPESGASALHNFIQRSSELKTMYEAIEASADSYF